MSLEQSFPTNETGGLAAFWAAVEPFGLMSAWMALSGSKKEVTSSGNLRVGTSRSEEAGMTLFGGSLVDELSVLE